MAAVLAAAVAADVSLVLIFPAAVPSFDATQLSSLSAVLISSPTGAIGVLLAARRPRNPAGWLLGAFAVLFVLSGLGSDYGFHWLYGHDLSQSLVAPMMLMGAAASQLAFMPLITVLLVFPDGHLLSRRWRVAIWLNALLAALASLVALLDPNIVGDGHRQLPNPIGLAGAHPALMAISDNVVNGGFVVLSAIGLISLGIRYRRADRDTRQQAKWFGAGVLVLVAAVVVGLITSPTSSWTTPIPIAAETIGFTVFPLCLGVAVLKYRLYGIDLVVNRALVYAALAVFITSVYVGIAVGIGTLVGSGGKPNLGLSIVATAIVAIGFQPLRERLQRVANRLVYGKRATPYEVLSQFSERVAESYASDDVLHRMARVLAEGTNADLAEVWLRSGDVLQRAAVFPLQPTVPAAVHVNSAAELSIPAADRAVVVRHQGDVLGALTVTKRRGESLTPIEIKLMDDLAHQAGLVLKNVGLTADLQARLVDLRASRQRLVTAQDDERRRLERNLHDGAQQHLVALKVKLGLAEMLMSRDAEKAKLTIAQLKGDADEALETLRDLARGIYPPLLAEKGLGAALESQARKATIPVTVDADGIGRYSQDIEAAVYFSVLEALQNVQKYARASAARVHLREEDRALRFEVTDDGTGFDVATTVKGSGLTNMADRVDALGGDVAITSAPGHGTQLRGSLLVPRVGALA
jgi:signal transduction histidine kinase